MTIGREFKCLKSESEAMIHDKRFKEPVSRTIYYILHPEDFKNLGLKRRSWEIKMVQVYVQLKCLYKINQSEPVRHLLNYLEEEYSMKYKSLTYPVSCKCDDDITSITKILCSMVSTLRFR